MPSLILLKAPGAAHTGQQHPLVADEILLGREDRCQIVVPNHAVSRQHAKIIKTNGQYYIEDLNSRNRTFVNNREITAPHLLKHEDRIKICDFLFTYHDEKAQKPVSVKPRLPNEFQQPEENPDETAEEDDGLSSVEHTYAARPNVDLLAAQPNEKLRVLLEISVSLSKTLDLEMMLSTVADSMFQVFRQADRCFIILSEDGQKLVPKVVKARRSGPDNDHRFSKTIVRKCMESLTAYLSEDASSDSAMGAAQSIAEFRIRSVMCVPLTGSEGMAIGAIQLDTQDRGKKFREDDLKMLLIVANLCAVAIEKASLHETQLAQKKQQNEIEIARKVQEGFLPKTPPSAMGYEFYSVYSAAQTVGGDYYDFIPMPDGRIAVLLGDVAGKGVPASLLMAKLSAEARFCMLTQPTPADAVNLLNEQLICGGIGDRFVTLAAVIINPLTNAVTIVNAGHLNPIKYHAETKSFEEVITNDQSGLPLGLVSGFEYQAIELTLEIGETLLIFTDGVTDAMSPTDVMFELEGVKKICVDSHPQGPANRPRVIGERLINALRKHAAGRPQNDDIAIVCVGRLLATLATDADIKLAETVRVAPRAS